MAKLEIQADTTLSRIEEVNKAVGVLPRDYLGFSQIGTECQRSLVYYFRHCYTEDLSAQLQRLFKVGHDAEPKIIKDLESIGVVMSSTQEAYSDISQHFRGHSDSIGRGFPEFPDEDLLIEFKTSNADSFKKLTKQGVKLNKPQHHAQMMLYGYKAGLKNCAYIVYCKNNSAYYIEFVPVDAEYAELMLISAEQVITREELPPKISENKSYYACKFCSAYLQCVFNEPMNKSCRNCEFASIEEEGKWQCVKHDKDITGSYEPCDDYKIDEWLTK